MSTPPPGTAERVPTSTREEVNEQLRQEIGARLQYSAEHPDEIDGRDLVMPAVIAAFLFQHALQGWCPPVPLFRRPGVRTQREIDAERGALEAMQDAQ